MAPLWKKMMERNFKTLGYNTGNPGLLLAPGGGEELPDKKTVVLFGNVERTHKRYQDPVLWAWHEIFSTPTGYDKHPRPFYIGAPPPGLLTPTFLLLPVIRDTSDPPSQYFVNPRGKDRAKLQNTGPHLKLH